MIARLATEHLGRTPIRSPDRDLNEQQDELLRTILTRGYLVKMMMCSSLDKLLRQIARSLTISILGYSVASCSASSGQESESEKTVSICPNYLVEDTKSYLPLSIGERIPDDFDAQLKERSLRKSNVKYRPFNPKCKGNVDPGKKVIQVTRGWGDDDRFLAFIVDTDDRGVVTYIEARESFR